MPGLPEAQAETQLRLNTGWSPAVATTQYRRPTAPNAAITPPIEISSSQWLNIYVSAVILVNFTLLFFCSPRR